MKKKGMIAAVSIITLLFIASSALFAMDVMMEVNNGLLYDQQHVEVEQVQLWSTYQQWANSIKPDFRSFVSEVCMVPSWGNYVSVTATIAIENTGGNYGLNYNPAYREQIPNFVQFSGSLYRSSVVWTIAPIRGETQYAVASAIFPFYGGNGQLPGQISVYADARGYWPHPTGWGGMIAELDEKNNYSYESTGYLFYNPPYPATYTCWN